MKNLSISFGGIHAVKNLSFSVNRGEILGLIGPNGSGKSTCVNLISGIYQPDYGEIYFCGKKLTRKDSVTNRVALGMGRTFQTPKPFGTMTVFENVYTVALLNNSVDVAKTVSYEILKRTNLFNVKDLPAEKLPIEKRKWLDLSRVLVNNPQFVMLDEVMAGLNPNEMQDSIQMIRDINIKGITFLFIEHVMKAVLDLCHRVIVINQGEYLSSGPPFDVLQEKEVIRAYIGGDIIA